LSAAAAAPPKRVELGWLAPPNRLLGVCYLTLSIDTPAKEPPVAGVKILAPEPNKFLLAGAVVAVLTSAAFAGSSFFAAVAGANEKVGFGAPFAAAGAAVLDKVPTSWNDGLLGASFLTSPVDWMCLRTFKILR